MSLQSRPIYEFGPFVLDTGEGLLLRYGEVIALTLKAYEILLVLVQNSGHVVEKEFFLKTIWPNTYVEEANLTQNIFRLRKILEDSKSGNHYIETVPKRGYRFVAHVREVVNGNGGIAVESAAQPHQAKTEETALSNGIIRSLAVLPLDNLDTNRDTEYLSDGIMESILNSLSQLHQLRVVAWSTMVHYKGKAIDVLKIGRELGVQFCLTGKLLLLSNKLVVRVELVDIENGWQVWGEQYQRDFSDILTVQEDISWEVSERLRLKLTGEEKHRLAQRHTEDPEAFKLYLRGRFFWNQRTPESLKKAMAHMQKAIEIDPDFALAYVGLADCYNQLSDFNLLAPREAFPKAKAAAMKALELNETLAEAQASLAFVRMVYDWDWSSAERGFKQAIAQSSNYMLAHQWHARYLAQMGCFNEALSEIERARQIDSQSLVCMKEIAQILYLAREYDRAIEQCRETLELDPDFTPAYRVISMAYAQKGMYEEAIDYCHRGSKFPSRGTRASALLGCFYAALGHREKALDKLDELNERARQQYVSPGYNSIIYVGLGKNDLAIKYLENAYQDRSEFLTYLKVLPLLDPLRSDERFINLLGRMGFRTDDSFSRRAHAS